MTVRINRHNSTNGKNGRSIQNLGEYGWWGNFGSWGSWVKYVGNMEGVGKCVGVWGEVREGVGRYVGGLGKYGEVWGMGSRCVEVCLGCGERCGKGVGLGLVLGKGRWKVWGEMLDNLGERGSVGRRVVSRYETTTLLTPTHSTPTPLTSTPSPRLCVFWPQRAFSLFLYCGLNACFVEYLEETKLEFFQT